MTKIKQCVQRSKNKSWPPIMPEQRERCLEVSKTLLQVKIAIIII
jgi:hypothetical protein